MRERRQRNPSILHAAIRQYSQAIINSGNLERLQWSTMLTYQLHMLLVYPRVAFTRSNSSSMLLQERTKRRLCP